MFRRGPFSFHIANASDGGDLGRFRDTKMYSFNRVFEAFDELRFGWTMPTVFGGGMSNKLHQLVSRRRGDMSTQAMNWPGKGGDLVRIELAMRQDGLCRDSWAGMRSAVCSRQRMNRSRVRYDNAWKCFNAIHCVATFRFWNFLSFFYATLRSFKDSGPPYATSL
jgi:hypothetical protein